jgi:hypothetical protein
MSAKHINNISFETLVESLTFDCWAVNLDMVYIYQNDTSIENWGRVIGKSVDELNICDQTKSIWKAQLKKVLNGEKIINDYAVEELNKYYHSTITPPVLCIGTPC